MKTQLLRERLTACFSRPKSLLSKYDWIERLEPRRLLSTGALDPTFGTGGIVTDNPRATLSGFAQGCAVERNGKILVAGFASNLTARDVATVTCFNANGSVDTSFGVNGTVDYSSPTGLEDTFTCVVVQSNGKILAGGTSADGSGESTFLLVRFKANGLLDTSFGNHGIVTTAFGDGQSQTSYMALRGDGVIVAAGLDSTASNDYLALACYHPNGSLDLSIGNGGIIESNAGVSAGSSPQPNGMAISGNKIIVSTQSTIVEFTHTGRMNQAFGNGGVASSYLSQLPFGDINWGLDVLSNGDILAGISSVSVGVAELTPTGQLNTRFGNDGFGLCPQPNTDTTWPFMTVQGNGDIVIAADANDARTQIDLFRITPRGGFDRTFGSGGLETYDSGTTVDATGLIAQSNSKLLISYYSTFGNNTAPDGIELLRLNANAHIDGSFGINGQAAATPTGPGANSFDDLALAGNGDIYAVLTESGVPAGSYNYIPNQCLARYAPNGTLDTSFGSDGQVAVPYDMSAVAVQSDGKILVGGIVLTSQYAPPGEVSITRYNSDGSVDTSFGDQGTVAFDISYGLETGYTLSRIVAEPDGTTMAMIGGSVSEFVHLSSTGQMIGTPSPIGLHPGYYAYDGLSDLAIASDGKLVVPDDYTPGFTRSSEPPAALIVERFNADLSPDTTFGTNGMVSLTQYAGFSYTGENAVAIEPGGSILVSADSSAGNVLIRLTSTGTLDPTFGNDGVITTPVAITSLLLQPNGKIIAVGAFGFDLDILRFNNRGALDPTFGSKGQLLTPFGGAVTSGRMIFEPDGSALAIGDAVTQPNQYSPATEAFMARFDLDA